MVKVHHVVSEDSHLRMYKHKNIARQEWCSDEFELRIPIVQKQFQPTRATSTVAWLLPVRGPRHNHESKCLSMHDDSCLLITTTKGITAAWQQMDDTARGIIRSLSPRVHSKFRNNVRNASSLKAPYRIISRMLYWFTCPRDVSYETSPVVLNAGSKARAAALKYRDTSSGLSPNFATCIRGDQTTGYAWTAIPSGLCSSRRRERGRVRLRISRILYFR